MTNLVNRKSYDKLWNSYLLDLFKSYDTVMTSFNLAPEGYSKWLGVKAKSTTSIIIIIINFIALTTQAHDNCSPVTIVT